MPEALTELEIDGLTYALENRGWSLRPDYSGRGMYGENCIGIVHPSGEAAAAVICLIEALAEEGLDETADWIRSASSSSDNMGLDVITYWPQLKAEAPECEGHESTRGDLMGGTFYCDGSCQTA